MYFHKEQNDGKGQVTRGRYYIKKKKIQGNVGKDTAGRQIEKTLEVWGLPQSAAQGKCNLSLQVIQQSGIIACIRNLNDISVHILLILLQYCKVGMPQHLSTAC